MDSVSFLFALAQSIARTITKPAAKQTRDTMKVTGLSKAAGRIFREEAITKPKITRKMMA